jgi:hypothetical protein
MLVSAALALSLCSIGYGSSASGPVTQTKNPLVAEYKLSVPAGSTTRVEFGTDTSYGFVTSAIASLAPTVSVLVAGMKENSAYHMRAVVTCADGTKSFDDDHVFHTGAAPAGRLPKTVVTLPSGVTPAPGVELLCLNPPPNNPGNLLRVVALNPSGEFIWYYDFDPRLGTAQPFKLLRNGHFLTVLFGGTTGPGGMVREIDLAGRAIHEFTVDQLNQWIADAGYTWRANAIHHDITELPNGHLLVLVNTKKKFTDLRGYSAPTMVLGDAIVDLDPNYKPVWSWSSFDHLDVNRHPMLFPDWTHTNTIEYSKDDGNIVLSLRNQSWVIKIDYANGRGTGNVIWRLGYQGDFTLLDPTSSADWFFAQHFADFIASKSTGDFQLTVFDNGNNRFPNFSRNICPSVPDEVRYTWPAFFGIRVPDCYSRSVVFGVSEKQRTARLLWSHVVPYSYWGGVSMDLPSGNMFFDISNPSEHVGRFDNLKPSLTIILIEEMSILAVVLLLFFWPMPAVFIPLTAIPIAVIFAWVPVLSVVAVAIGLMIDATVLVFAQPQTKPKHQSDEDRANNIRGTLVSAMKRINRPSFFALVAVGISSLPIFAPREILNARVMEVTRQQPPQLVWELDVSGQESYRTIHLPSLYPEVQW